MGQNVYLTGSAGSGKTYVLKQYISYLKSLDVEVGITASTGIAATHLEGITIHAWSGLGIRNKLSIVDLDAMEQRSYLWKRFEKVKVLIIDEISMLHHFRLDLVDQVLRHFKRRAEPFGGIQIILCGDFFQLPPIVKNGEEGKFAFEARAWKEMNMKVCYLHEQHRQSDDQLLTVLNAIRSNTADEDTLEILMSRFKKDVEVGRDIEPTKLYTHNRDVESINQTELSKLRGPYKIYAMESRGKGPILEILKKSILAPEQLILKEGTRVLFVKNNFEAGYVNGTLGTVIGFEAAGPVVETLSGKRIVVSPATWIVEEDGKMKAEVTQLPLRLAWAITVHKSQGMSLEAAEIDLTNSFERGMGYVALSRLTSLEGLKLLGLNNIAMSVSEEILEFDKTLLEQSLSSEDWFNDMPEAEREKMKIEFMQSILPSGKEKKEKRATHLETAALLAEQLSIKEMADRRGLTEETIIGHLEKTLEEGVPIDLSYLKEKVASDERFMKIEKAFLATLKNNPDYRLSPVKSKLRGDFTFAEIRFARLFIKPSE